tara:strand:+ start:1420 stop:2154 length:735 start_codon:yes stop_codon:yes gene_type:complete
MKEFKKCKGTGKALGFGCENEVPQVRFNRANRIYGLGKSCGCYQSWLLHSESGTKFLAKTMEQNSKKSQRETLKAERVKKLKTRTELMSVSQYRSKVLQPVINNIARQIDYGCPCIATDNYGKENGGHYISVGANVTICLNLHNIHIQSFESNHFKSGDVINYRAGIIKRYGSSYMLYMDNLQGCPTLHLSKQEVMGVHKIAVKILKRLNLDTKHRGAEDRVKLRNEINLELGVYNEHYSMFIN